MISIIVPVYNTEKYLHRCIDSVLAQTYKDFELLLIDDGSTDSSGAICDEYAEKDGRVRVFHKKNGGVSSARNLGLDNAQGEWITFVDSDDYIEENFLKSFDGNLDADLLIGNSVNVQSNDRKGLNKIQSGKYEDVDQFLSSNLQELICRTPWGKMYRKIVISDLRFNENMRLGEDTLYNLSYFRRIQSVSVNSKGFVKSSYAYCTSEACKEKYKMPVEICVNYLTMIGHEYEFLNIRCEKFENFIVWFFSELCAYDIPKQGAIWYKNEVIRKLSLRRAKYLGKKQWVKTWLLFHGLYRLKSF